MSDIAPLNTISNSLDTVAKLIRVLDGEGVTLPQLMQPMNDKVARRNLAAFLKAGCPKTAVSAKVGTSQDTPIVFERNEHGHVIVTITGLDLTGEQEIERLVAAGFRVSDYAKSCFKSTNPDSYDKNHRLVAGQSYKIALIPGKEIRNQSDRSTANLRKLGEKYGYGKPLGGHISRIREVVSDKQMEEMGLWYIASLHDPIKDSDGDPNVLGAGRSAGGRWVDTYWDGPDGQWDDGGAFAFPVPAS